MRRLPMLAAVLAVVLVLGVLLGTREEPAAVRLVGLDSAENAGRSESVGAGALTAVAVGAAELEPALGGLVEDHAEPTERASAAPTAPAFVEVVVLVEREDGRLVGDALVAARARTGHVSAGRASAAGRVELRVPAGEPVRFRAQAPGYAEAALDSAPPHPARVRLVLPREGVLAGRVVYSDGAPVGLGVEVRAESDDAGPREVHATRTNAEGAFALADVDHARRWRITAAARYLVCVDPVVRRLDGEPVRVVVGELFGAVVELVEPGGTPIRPSSDGRRDRWAWRTPPRAPGEPAPVEPALAVAAGLPPELAEPRADRRVVLRAAAPTASGVLAPVSVAVDVAGYEPASIAVAPRALSRGLATATLVLRPRGSARLELDVLLPGGGVEAGTTLPTVELVLRDGERYPERFVVPLRDGRVVVEGLPVGRRSAYLDLPGTRSDWPSAPVELVLAAGATASWTVDLRGYGGLLLPGGRSFAVVSASGNSVRAAALLGPDGHRPSGAERALLLLEPGEWTLRAAGASSSEEADRPDARVAVRAGQVAELGAAR